MGASLEEEDQPVQTLRSGRRRHVVLKLYPDQLPGRIARLTLDALVLAWTALWVIAGIAIHRTVLQLEVIADGVASTGRTFDSWIAAFRSSTPPVPGFRSSLQSLADSLERATGAQLVQRGAAAHDAIERLALVLAVVVVLPPILTVASRFVSWRWRDARERGAALTFVSGVHDPARRDEALALLAFRAVATLPFGRIVRVSPDPVGELLAGQYEALAGEMLKGVGLRPRRLE